MKRSHSRSTGQGRGGHALSRPIATPPGPRQIRFVRLLIGRKGARKHANGQWIIQTPSGRAWIDAGQADAMIDAGIVQTRRTDLAKGHPGATALVATNLARNWLRRALAEHDPHSSQHRFAPQHRFAAQHRLAAPFEPGGPVVNLAESPIARLARPGPGGTLPFLLPHHYQAGERVRALVEKAALRPRTTMNYAAQHSAGGKNLNIGQDLTDMALDARTRINHLHAAMAPDCFAILIDVCGYLKGLQQVETERQWPRRSAKMVLRIALDAAAAHFGTGLQATGPPAGPTRHWSDTNASMPMFPDKDPAGN